MGAIFLRISWSGNCQAGHHDLGLGHPLKFLWEKKAQGLTTYPNFWKQFGQIRSVRKELQRCGHEQASAHIEAAITHMRHFNKVVPYFQALLAQVHQHKSALNPLGRNVRTGQSDAPFTSATPPPNPSGESQVMMSTAVARNLMAEMTAFHDLPIRAYIMRSLRSYCVT